MWCVLNSYLISHRCVITLWSLFVCDLKLYYVIIGICLQKHVSISTYVHRHTCIKWSPISRYNLFCVCTALDAKISMYKTSWNGKCCCFSIQYRPSIELIGVTSSWETFSGNSSWLQLSSLSVSSFICLSWLSREYKLLQYSSNINNFSLDLPD